MTSTTSSSRRPSRFKWRRLLRVWARGSVPNDDDGDSTESRTNTWQAAMTEAGFIADWSNDLDLLLLVRDGSVALEAAEMAKPTG